MVPAHRVKPTSKAAEDEGSKLAEDVVAMTQEEGGKGRASGPLSADEVTGRIGPTWLPSHRRGVTLSGKKRWIDNFSVGLVN